LGTCHRKGKKERKKKATKNQNQCRARGKEKAVPRTSRRQKKVRERQKKGSAKKRKEKRRGSLHILDVLLGKKKGVEAAIHCVHEQDRYEEGYKNRKCREKEKKKKSPPSRGLPRKEGAARRCRVAVSKGGRGGFRKKPMRERKREKEREEGNLLLAARRKGKGGRQLGVNLMRAVIGKGRISKNAWRINREEKEEKKREGRKI